MSSEEFKALLDDAKRRSQQYVCTFRDEHELCFVNGIPADEYCKKHFGIDLWIQVMEDTEQICLEMFLDDDSDSIEGQSITVGLKHMHLLQRLIPNLNQAIAMCMVIDQTELPKKEEEDTQTFKSLFS